MLKYFIKTLTLITIVVYIYIISIIIQVILEILLISLVDDCVISCYNDFVIIAETLILKMAVYRFVDVSEEEVNTMKEKAIPKAQKMRLSPGLTLFEGKI